MKTKRLAILLAIVMLFGTFNILPAAAAFSAEDKYEILCAFGFFDKSTAYSPNASVTRGEIINALVNSLPAERRLSFSKGDTSFSDVSSSDPVAELAYNARMLGIFEDETELKPYEQATLEDASFMILNLLGYGKAVSASYSAYASGIGLTKSIPSSSKFTMNQLVIMLYNALETDLMQWRQEGEKMTLGTVSGETYLTEILKGGKGRGTINANRFTGIYGNKAVAKDYLKIDNTLYLAGDIPQDKYLGTYADYYYRENENNEETLVYVKPYDEDSIVEFDAERIQSFENMTYTYETAANIDRTRKATVLKSADIVYNGKLISGDFDAYVPGEGRIRLIDNDGDSKYEIVLITDYEVVAVGSVDTAEGVITNLYYPEREYKVDLYENESTYWVCAADGTVKKFSDIFKYYTIFIAQSYDKELCTIVISDRKIKGSVNSFADDTIVIDGVTYEYTDDFMKFNDVKLHSYGTFYIDPFGKIGCYDPLVDRNIKAGYMLRAAKDDVEDNLLLIKMFTENGDVETLYTAEKLYYTNGNDENPTKVKAENVDVVLSALEASMDSEIGGGQLILYKQNGQGRISEIEIPASYTSDINRSEALDKGGKFRRISTKIPQTTHKNGMFNLSLRIGSDTKVFSIPSDIDNTKKFEVYTGLTNCFQWNQQYTVVGYAKNVNAPYADYVLGFLGGTDGVVDENNVFVVESVNETLNEDDICVKIIKGMWGTTKKEYILDEDLSATDINGGDVLRLGFDDSGNVRTLVKALDIKKQTPGTSGSLTAKYYQYFGYAYDMKGSTLRIATKNPEEVTLTTELINTYSDKMAAIYKYDSKTKKLTSVGYDSIKTYKSNPGSYSKVFAWFYYSDHKMMIIYD